MRVAQVISSMGQKSSGVQAYVAEGCKALMAAGVETTLYTCGDVREFNHGYTIKTYPRSSFPSYALARSPQLKAALKREIADFDVIQANGLWQLPNIYPAMAAQGKRVKLVTMPHGTLSSWALSRSRLRKRMLWLWGQRVALERTDMFIATSEKEYSEIRDVGYRQPVAVIPIGMSVPDDEVLKVNAKSPEKTRKKVVFLGRVHKVKGIDLLVLAWERIAKDFHGWNLEIAGPDCGMRGEIETMVRQRSIQRVSFVGEVSGEEKYAFLASADICVLPSHTENFGITVAEALACGTPVIASKGTPWQGVEANRCGCWVDCDVATLAKTLKSMMVLRESERREMGSRGREWIMRDFEWMAVGLKLKTTYEWLIGQDSLPMPDWVRND